MTFKSKTLHGVVYGLSHLDPFVMSVAPKSSGAPTFRVGVTFNSHVFTRVLTPEDAPDLAYADGAEIRAFCTERYRCSLALPQIVRDAASGSAFFGNDRNYSLRGEVEGVGEPYAIFFNLERAKRPPFDVRMFVVSAYPKTGWPKRLARISFATLVSKTARGEPIRSP